MEASVSDFDPLERERLRQFVERYGGDRSLLGLDDSELEGALGLVRQENGRPVPTLAGLLILGREAALRDFVPTHEVAFQVMDGTEVRVNDIKRTPLLKTAQRIEEQFLSRRVEKDVQVGLFRVPVPNYDERAFREALINALIHRDYTRLGAVHIRWQPESIVVSSPGGFVEGVGLDNLLVVEPRPRNPLLADAIKPVAKALGRSAVDTRQTALVFHERAKQGLHHVAEHGRITRRDAAALFQIGDDQASRLLRKLSHEGKLRRHGSGRDIWYGPV
jgi:ATP-dependent DNA helicase RecG